jgi:AraC family transcriptional regulator, transcriptional activator FtrA
MDRHSPASESRRYRRARRVLRGAVLAVTWFAAALALPAAIGTANVRPKMAAIWQGGGPLPAGPLPSTPAHDATRRTAVLLLGDSLTEATDFLVPFEVLGASGEYNVYAVARERRPLRMFPGELAVLPHFSYEEFAALGAAPDIIVVPYMEADTDEAIVRRGEFLRQWWTGETLLLTICGGSYSAARTGVLAGRTATSHTNVLRLVRQQLTDVTWLAGSRYVDDGTLVSSAGITSGMDATLHLLAREHGRELALRVAEQVGYPHTQYLDDPAFRVPGGSPATTILNAAFRRQQTMALAIFDGASEITLSALSDTYTRTFSLRVLPLSTTHRVVTTRHGLHVVPRGTMAGAEGAIRLFTAGAPAPEEVVALGAWQQGRGVTAEEPEGTVGFAYDVALLDMARRSSPAAALEAARGLEYPVDHLGLASSLPPAALLARPLLLALAGVLMYWLLQRGWRRLQLARGRD